MKITDVSTRLIDQYMFVRVDTDEGISGVGESGAWAFLEASEAVVETFKRYLIGQNPLLIEHHWQYMYRCYHFRGAAIMGALSAIDIALWDIKGNITVSHAMSCWGEKYGIKPGSIIMYSAPPEKN